MKFNFFIYTLHGSNFKFLSTPKNIAFWILSKHYIFYPLASDISVKNSDEIWMNLLFTLDFA